MAELDIDIVQPDRLGADEHLAGAGRGHLGLLDREHFRAAVGVVPHASHTGNSFAKLDREST